MHDPQTVAFEIRRPWPRKRTAFDRAHGWRSWPPLVTIWHVDPEIGGSDDSCGFSYHRLTTTERERAQRLGEQEYRNIFARRWADAAGKDYASVCYDLSPLEAIYWAWRRLKHDTTPRWRRPIWNWGARLGRREIETIWSLASSPVDNLKHTIDRCHSEDACGELFMLIERVRLTRSRPWYRRPRWHVHHWKFQIHALQAFKRWAFSRCAGCGRRFTWGYSPVTFQWDNGGPKWFKGEHGIYHSECSGRGGAKEPV